MYKVYKDQPIKNATHFNFNVYSNALASIILNKENKTPFTIAINGKWGSGKTTLMKTLRNELDSSNPNDKNRKVRTVWFDADLSDIKFKHSDLSLANFEGANLYDTNFEGTNLDKSNFSRVRFNDYTLESIIHSSIWKTATFDHTTSEKLISLSKENQKSNEI